MKTFKDSFEEVFTWVEVPADNKKGFKIKYVYTGPWYMWRVSAEEKKRNKRVIGALCVLDILFFAVAGLMPGSLNTVKWVEIPGLFSLIPLIYEIIGVVFFCLAKEKIQQLDFKRIKLFLGASPMIRGAFTATTAIAGIYAVGIAGVSAYHIGAIVLYAASCAASFILGMRFKKIPHTSERNDVIKHIHDGVLEEGTEAHFA